MLRYLLVLQPSCWQHQPRKRWEADADLLSSCDKDRLWGFLSLGKQQSNLEAKVFTHDESCFVSLIIFICAWGLLSSFFSDRTCQKVLIVACPSLMWSSLKVPRVITGSTVCRLIGEVPVQEDRSYVTYVPAQWRRNQGASRPLPCSWPWHRWLPKKRAQGLLYTVYSPPIDFTINIYIYLFLIVSFHCWHPVFRSWHTLHLTYVCCVCNHRLMCINVRVYIVSRLSLVGWILNRSWTF